VRAGASRVRVRSARRIKSSQPLAKIATQDLHANIKNVRIELFAISSAKPIDSVKVSCCVVQVHSPN
jgi:hypothetical protein